MLAKSFGHRCHIKYQELLHLGLEADTERRRALLAGDCDGIGKEDMEFVSSPLLNAEDGCYQHCQSLRRTGSMKAAAAYWEGG